MGRNKKIKKLSHKEMFGENKDDFNLLKKKRNKNSEEDIILIKDKKISKDTSRSNDKPYKKKIKKNF